MNICIVPSEVVVASVPLAAHLAVHDDATEKVFPLSVLWPVAVKILLPKESFAAFVALERPIFLLLVIHLMVTTGKTLANV
jgi:hypothetical protein